MLRVHSICEKTVVIADNSLTVTHTLTSRWHCVLKHLVELAEVHDHGEFVWLYHR